MKKSRREITKIEELTYELKVRQAMSKRVATVTPGVTINRFRTLLRDEGISGAPVVSRGRMVGIISLEDLIKCLINREMDAPVSSKMTRTVTLAHPDEPLIHAVHRLEQTGHGRLPVVDRKSGRLVGILTKGDVILCLLKKLEELYTKEEQQRYQAGHLFEDLTGEEIRLLFCTRVKGGDFKHAGEASSRLRQNLVRLGVPPDYVRRVAIASYEAEMNMVIYSHKGILEACVEKHQVQVKAWDQGPGIPDIGKALTPGFSTAPDWVRELGFGAGMGLPNIRQHSDHLNIDSTVGRFTHLTFEVRLP
jgi:CBS domain-containing protein/anti-sigma regulatory factor (Ser/Thr protein kinase)